MPQSTVERTLGVLLAKVEGIEKHLADVKHDLVDAEAKSDASRANVHRRLDEVVMRTTHLESDVASVKHKVDDMEKVTSAVTTLHTKAEGIGAFGRFLIRVGIVIVTIAGWMFGAYTALTGRPPP